MEGDHPAIQQAAQVKRCGSIDGYVEYACTYFKEKILGTYRCIDVRHSLSTSITTECSCLSEIMNYKVDDKEVYKLAFVQWLTYYLKLGFREKTLSC